MHELDEPVRLADAVEAAVDFVRLCDLLPLVEESKEWPMRLNYAASAFSRIDHLDREFIINGLRIGRFVAERDYLEKIHAVVGGHLHWRVDRLFEERFRR